MRVLLIGSGGREHALAWKLSQSPKLTKLYIAPGNAGTIRPDSGQAPWENVPIGAMEFDRLLAFAKENAIDLAVVAPDDPLAGGLVDRFEAAGIPAFGPRQAAAEIEASKVFSKQLMGRCGVPTAEFGIFSDHAAALAYLRSKGVPIVIKAKGLALGKGVYICHTLPAAEFALKEIMVEKIFGEAGSEVVMEEFLEGTEISIHAFCDGTSFRMFPSSQDHKTVFDNNRGPNTGGMGTIAPVPQFNSPADLESIGRTVIGPILEGLKKEGREFRGVLYPGLMLTKHGPRVLEFNARFGDPEAQSYMRLLKSDLVEILYACATGTLANIQVEWESMFTCCVVLASGGYPGGYEKGKIITGIAEAEQLPGVKVFHAGTAMKDGKLVTAGGRVFGVSAIGGTLREAIEAAYAAAKKINFPGAHCRRDIGKKSLEAANG